jgi:hypothetical protein
VRGGGGTCGGINRRLLAPHFFFLLPNQCLLEVNRKPAIPALFI